MDLKTLMLCLSVLGTVLSDDNCSYYSGSYRCNEVQSLDELSNPHEGPIFWMEIKDSNLRKIPENAFIDFPTMKYLSLNDIRIGNVAVGAFNGLPNLVWINLNKNNLTSLSLSDMPKLEGLEIKDNKISNLDLKLDELMILDMNNNLVTSLSFVEHLPKLKYLHVSGNRLICVDQNILLHLPLRRIILSNNPWQNDCGTSLSAWLENRNVFVQNQDDMEEQEIPRNESATGTCDFHNGVYSCNGLQLNTLENPHKGRIFRLEITNSSLREIPENAFIDFPSIEELYLDDNNIEKIAHGAFNGLSNFRILHLSGNNLTSLSLSGMPTLESIIVKDNKLSTLDLKLDNLEGLDLTNNLVTNLSFVEHLPKLSNFFINKNRVSCIDKKVFLDLPLRMVTLGDNPWRKDCGASFSAWLKERNVFVVDEFDIDEEEEYEEE